MTQNPKAALQAWEHKCSERLALVNTVKTLLDRGFSQQGVAEKLGITRDKVHSQLWWSRIENLEAKMFPEHLDENSSVNDQWLPVRVANVLNNSNLRTFGQIAAFKATHLRKFRQMGDAGVALLRGILQKHGMDLASE